MDSRARLTEKHVAREPQSAISKHLVTDPRENTGKTVHKNRSRLVSNASARSVAALSPATARCDPPTRAAPSLVAPSSAPEPEARLGSPDPSARAVARSRRSRVMMPSSPSTRRKLLLDSDEAPEDDQPCAWTCSYVMSSGDGVNLLGTLDVDRNRARFVANSGLFGTAYQFVMPRDQIQIVRVPTASSPYNALELHTKYRQNILCDFDDNVATFKRCCEVMKLDVLPQDEPLIAVLPTDVSDHANKWRARAAQKGRERARRGNVPTQTDCLRAKREVRRAGEPRPATKQWETHG